MALIVHVVEGEIEQAFETDCLTSATLSMKFPTGDVFLRMSEPTGATWALQWRVLQRSSQVGQITYYAMLLPVSVEQLPEVVQVVHACTT